MGPYTELSFFAGLGGFTLGLRLAGVPVQTVCYVERDPYCQRLITQRIEDGWLDDAPLWDDVRTFDGRPWRGHVDLLTAGFPCQPHSVAGQRRGADDERNLWPDTLRVIREVGPRYVLLENVPGILANGCGGTVVGQLSKAGYDCVWDCVSAAEVGASHKRDRWWCLAYAEEFIRGREPHFDGCGEAVAYTDVTPAGHGNDGDGSVLWSGPQRKRCGEVRPGEWWAVEPDVGRVAHGNPLGLDILRTITKGEL